MGTEIEAVLSKGELTSQADLRARRAHEKRLGGFSWEVVASEIGYNSPEEASVSVRAYLGRAVMRVSEQTRANSLDKELQRLDTLQSACWDLALQVT